MEFIYKQLDEIQNNLKKDDAKNLCDVENLVNKYKNLEHERDKLVSVYYILLIHYLVRERVTNY